MPVKRIQLFVLVCPICKAKVGSDYPKYFSRCDAKALLSGLDGSTIDEKISRLCSSKCKNTYQHSRKTPDRLEAK
jgi:hypothetical protein